MRYIPQQRTHELCANCRTRQIISSRETPYVLIHTASVWEGSFRVSRRGEWGERRASCYPEDAPRWEKGHRMALSSGSSVSEDVWTLIKMCRASGRVPFLSSIPSPVPLYPSAFLPFRLILHVAISSCAVYACDRPATFKAPGECHLDGSCSVVYVRGDYATTRGYVVISCHWPIERPTTDRLAGRPASKHGGEHVVCAFLYETPDSRTIPRVSRKNGDGFADVP